MSAGVGPRPGMDAGLGATDAEVLAVLASPPAIGSTAPAAVSATVLNLVSEAVTAHAGGTQAAGLQLSAVKMIHIVSVCATAADSVLLPTVVADQVHRVINMGAAACQVYGNGTSTINGIDTATGVSIPVGEGRDFHGGTAGAAGTWRMATAAAAFDPLIPGPIGTSGPDVARFTTVRQTRMHPINNAGVSAFAGGGQASATPLTTMLSVVVEVATTDDSVRLPDIVGVGDMVYVYNQGANALKIYGFDADTIDLTATATGIQIAAGKTVLFIADNASGFVDNWHAVRLD